MGFYRSLHSNECRLFCNHLRTTIAESGYTQAELAQKLNRPQSYISKCLSRERRMDIVEIYEVCCAIEHPIVEFVGEIEKMFK